MDVAKLAHFKAPPEQVGAVECAAVAHLFSSKREPLTGEHAKAAAENLKADQEKIYRAAFKMVMDLRAKSNVDSNIDRGIQTIFNRVLEPFQANHFALETVETGFTVGSNLGWPIIRPDDIEEFIDSVGGSKATKRSKSYVIDLVALLCAGFLIATRRGGGTLPHFDHQLGGLSVPLYMAIAKLEAFDLLQDESGNLLPQLAGTKATLDEMAAELGAQCEQVAKIGTEIDALQIRNHENTRYGDAFVEKVESMTTHHDALMKSLEERLRLNEARKLWGSSANSAAWSFYISGVVLILMLAAVPTSVFIWHNEIIAFLKTLEAVMIKGAAGNNSVAGAVSAIGRLFILTAPLGFIVWMIRILVRYNTRSLLLMDDAKQRVTMLNTYLYLIEQDAAVKQDRGAILEALFRRAPGHGGDTVEPPHFTDLLKYGQETAGRG